ncbi:hypothetical protein R50073_44420 [Maricurvus nonylphenolicus]|uniref:substrate-binding periplasmic protein n=1 Tax=Maricurvus nonylphenolicus TaxID=1008307 RepID=UPI0036F29434
MKPNSLIPLFLFGIISGFIPTLCSAQDQPSQPPASQVMRHGALGLANLATIENNKVIGGFKYDFLEALGKRLGISLTHQACPFQRCLRSMSDGQLDIMMFIAVTPERSRYLKYIQIWEIPVKMPFYVRKGEEDRLREYTDLHQLHVGVVNGYAYFSRFDNDSAIQKSKVMREEQLPKMLQAGRIDAFVAFGQEHQKLLATYPGLVPAPFSHAYSDTALIAIGHTSPFVALMPEMEQIALEMIQDGTMDKLWHKHFKHQMPYPSHLRKAN